MRLLFDSQFLGAVAITTVLCSASVYFMFFR